VDEKIGQSSFKCSLGVKRQSEDREYSLGILVDDEAHYNNDDLVEQYFLRPSILQAFGWRMISVFAKDWLEDSHRVLLSIEKRLNEEKVGDNPVNGVEELPIPLSEKQEDVTSARFQSGDGERFWEIAQDKLQLQIRFGKSGTRGQVQIKSFISEAEAATIKEELMREQIGLGYKKMT
jgi:predicted DNA-binding WGR domain protein